MTEHHKFHGFCTNRLPYRSGNIPRAVKTYTISDESIYLLIFNIPSINIIEELVGHLNQFGDILKFEKVENYPGPVERFSEVLLVKYKNLKSAKLAKMNMDNYSFMGNVLHVCYAPENENLDETRNKLATHASFVRNFISNRFPMDKTVDCAAQRGQRSKVSRISEKRSAGSTKEENSTFVSTSTNKPSFDVNEKQNSSSGENVDNAMNRTSSNTEKISKCSVRTRPRLKLKLR